MYLNGSTFHQKAILHTMFQEVQMEFAYQQLKCGMKDQSFFGSQSHCGKDIINKHFKNMSTRRMNLKISK